MKEVTIKDCIDKLDEIKEGLDRLDMLVKEGMEKLVRMIRERKERA